MIFRDMNQSWIKPEGTVIDILEAGPCLQVVFASPLVVEHIQIGIKTTSVYVNDMGREVMRIEQDKYFPELQSPTEAPVVHRWFRFKNAVLLILEGIQEAIRCLKK